MRKLFWSICIFGIFSFASHAVASKLAWTHNGSLVQEKETKKLYFLEYNERRLITNAKIRKQCGLSKTKVVVVPSSVLRHHTKKGRPLKNCNKAYKNVKMTCGAIQVLQFIRFLKVEADFRKYGRPITHRFLKNRKKYAKRRFFVRFRRDMAERFRNAGHLMMKSGGPTYTAGLALYKKLKQVKRPLTVKMVRAHKGSAAAIRKMRACYGAALVVSFYHEYLTFKIKRKLTRFVKRFGVPGTKGFDPKGRFKGPKAKKVLKKYHKLLEKYNLSMVFRSAL